MSEPFIGEILLFAGNFAPRGWALCQGQLLSISSNSALFSILGTTYGGDGESTFGLPDLRGRAPVGPRTGAGLAAVSLGEVGGAESVTLTQAQIPAHTHALLASTDDATRRDPAGQVAARASEKAYDATPSGATPMQGATLENAGSSQSHNNVQPYNTLNYIIALVGTYPSRS